MVVFKTTNQGGGSLATSFVDTFQRNDTAHGLGASYVGMPRSSLQSAQGQPMCRVVGNQMSAFVEGAGAGSKVPGVIFLPIPLLNSKLYGKRQYAELTWDSRVGGDSDIGPSVMMSGDTASQNQQGYQIEVDAPNIVLNLLTSVRTQLATAAYVPAAGDVWRLEVIPGVASNALTVKINGVTVIAYADADVSRPVNTGYPAIWFFAGTIGGIDLFTRFAAGII